MWQNVVSSSNWTQSSEFHCLSGFPASDCVAATACFGKSVQPQEESPKVAPQPGLVPTESRPFVIGDRILAGDQLVEIIRLVHVLQAVSYPIVDLWRVPHSL